MATTSGLRRVLTLWHHRIIEHLLTLENAADKLDDLEEALTAAEAEVRWMTHPRGTDARPEDAPAWWDEEEAGREAMAAMRSAGGMQGANVR